MLTALVAVVMSAKAEISFGYDAGAEIVTSYIWRGQYNGGLSFQPDLEIGFDADHMSFRIGAWGNIGASDYLFKKGLSTYTDPESGDVIDPNTRLVPELDIVGSLGIYGLTVGFNHYYYFGGSNFFSWKSVSDLAADDTNTSTTEVWAGYNFGELTKAGLYFNWYSTIAGQDLVYDENGAPKRAWSSYFEVGYDHTFEAIGLTIGAVVGMSPWASPIYGNEKFAVNNVSLKLNKEWEFEHITLDLFAQASVNPDGINKDNVVLWKASGDEKLCNQKLNGVIGFGFWF